MCLGQNRIFLAKLSLLAFSYCHDNHFFFFSLCFKLDQNISFYQGSEISTHMLGQNDEKYIYRQTDIEIFHFMYTNGSFTELLHAIVAVKYESCIRH